MKLVKRFCATVAAILMVLPTMAEVEFHTGGVEKLYEMAQSKQKLVFMDLYASWCPPCKTMERTVFSREDVGDFMSENFVSAKYNVDEDLGKRLSAEYQVRSIPTYLIFTPEGELLGRMMGAMSSEDFMKAMSQFLE